MSARPALRPLVATELALHRHHGVVVATVVVTAAWSALLLALPATMRPAAVAWVLLVDLGALGFFFVPALAVLEREHGITAALGLTRLTPGRPLAVRVGMFMLLSLLAAAVLLVVSGSGWRPGVLAGTALTSALFSVLAVVMVGRAVTLTSYMSRVPGVAAPLLAPALLHGTGVVASPLLHLSPATGAFELLAGRWSWPAAAWITLWIALLCVAAVRIGFDVEPRRSGQETRQHLGARTPPRRVGAVRSFLAVDGRTLRSDRILLLILAGVPLVALAVRWFSGGGIDLVADRYGVDAGPHLPFVHAFVVVIHIPAMIGSLTGLLFLEDRDAGLLPAVLVTRASLPTLVAYRLVATMGLAAASVLVAHAVAGIGHPGGVAGVLATVAVAAAVSVVPALVLAVLGRDRAHGMALTKLLGLPLYVPLASWFLDGPSAWLLAVSPTWWAAQASWAPQAAAGVAFASGGVAITAALAAVALPRLRAL